MKKKILFVLILAVLFSACKMKLSENSGTVFIDFGGNERAVDSEDLPIIKDAAMSLEINSSSQGTQKIDFAVGKEKTWSGTFPVGEELTITVTVRTAAAQWRGSARHRVTSGVNTVSIKLKKSAAALNSLLFGTDKSHSGGPHDYTLTLKIGSEEIKKEHIINHSFCRDNKGRTYLAYQEGNDYKLERYTSEGNNEDKNFTLPEHCHKLMLASDHKTGKVYLVAEIRGSMKLYRINEDGTHTELTGDPIGYTTGYAVYNNVVVASSYASGVQGQVLKMYRVNGDNHLSEITLSTSQLNLSEDAKIMLGSFSDPHVRINDLYMTSDSLYVLFSDFSKDREYYSLGGIVKYSYKSDGTISRIERIGIKENHTAQNGIYATDDNNLYGPVKVVGFDAENLYIADDGVRFEFEKGKPRIKENKNRIATLNRNDDKITFTDAASGISWQNESPVWPGVDTKALVWKKNSYGGFDYYQLENAGDTLPSETFKPGDANVSGDNSLTDVFCYDEAGNLYIVKYRSGTYQVCRFELKDDGSYNTSPVIAGQGTSTIINFPGKPTAIAVDISGTVKDGDGNPLNVLYYESNGDIKRLKWKGDFTDAQKDTSFNVSPGVGKTITALAANKDGLFVGEFLKLGSPGNHKYKIHVKKYPHDRPNYGDPQGTIIIVDEAQQIDGIEESLNALYIQDGVLYGLTTKTKKEDSAGKTILFAQSGRLLKLGNTSSFSSGNAVKLYGDDGVMDTSDGNFAPYRFIAVKPKKLVIASNGAYGKKNTQDAENKNKVWIFTPDSSGVYNQSSSVDTHGDVKFSKELKWDTGCGFLWE